MASIKINTAGMKRLVRDVEKRAAKGIQIPLDGSEDEASRSVKDELK